MKHGRNTMLKGWKIRTPVLRNHDTFRSGWRWLNNKTWMKV
jgi:hypothetical protein